MITQEKLKSLLNYNRQTGKFSWLNTVENSRKGRTAGSVSNGYIIININKKNYYAHRLAWLYEIGYLPEFDIDHINRNKSDNRLSNLREVSRQCNLRNTGNISSNTSGVKGVYYSNTHERWVARIMLNQKTKTLGYHKEFEEAVLQRLSAEQCLNWGDCNSSSPAYQYYINKIKQ